MKIVQFIFSLLFGLIFINAGLNKFLNYMPMPEMTPEQMKIMEAFVKISWLMPLVGAMEIIGGILFIIPRLRALGAIVILPVMAGVFLHNMVFEPSGRIFVTVLLVINLWVIADNWRKYRPMVS